FVGRTETVRKADERRTLNGHACGEKGPLVCGVYYSSERFPYTQIWDNFRRGDDFSRGDAPKVPRGHSAIYSGAGPTGGKRTQPNLSLPMEDGLYLEGTVSIGTRSGAVWRMRGTSTAAPAGAR